MKNKKITSLILVFAIMLSLFPSVSASAKAKLSATSKTLTVGKTATIKITGSKSAKWYVSNGKIRIVKSTKTYAKIKAVSKGTSYLKAKIGNKTYKCKITIIVSNSNSNNTKVNFDSKKAKESIETEKLIANGALFVKLKSNYKYATNVSAKCTFYDSKGTPVDYHNDSISFLEKGHTAYLKFSLPSVSYSTYKLDYEYSEGMKYFYHSSVIDNLSLQTNYVKDEYYPFIMLQVSNSGKVECSYCEVAIVYYDSNGKILDIRMEPIGEIPSGSSNTEKSYTPYDRNTYEDIVYDHYDAFITYAYHFGK